MIHFRIDIFGWRRVNELFEENQRLDAKIQEMKTGQHFQQVQLRGYGKDFERLLRLQQELEAKIQALTEDRDEWIRKYKLSEDARKDLGDKWADTARERDRLQNALDVLRGPLQQKGTPTAACGGTSPSGGGIEAQPGVSFDLQKGRTVL